MMVNKDSIIGIVRPIYHSYSIKRNFEKEFSGNFSYWKILRFYLESPFRSNSQKSFQISNEIALRYVCDKIDDEIEEGKADFDECKDYIDFFKLKREPKNESSYLLHKAGQSIAKNGYDIDEKFLTNFVKAQFIKSSDISDFKRYKEICKDKAGKMAVLIGMIYVPDMRNSEIEALHEEGVALQFLDDVADVKKDIKDDSSNGVIILSKELGIPLSVSKTIVIKEADKIHTNNIHKENLRKEVSGIIENVYKNVREVKKF